MRHFSADYPNKPITFIVPFEAGGPSDIVARVLAENLRGKLGQSVVVENKGGAGGAIGSEAIANAKSDGYTIGLATISTHVVNPSCNRHLKYDPVKSFTPVAMVGSMPNILVVRKELKVASFAQFRELVKNKSASYNLGTAGPCSYGHVMLEHLNQDLGTRIVHIPYRGSGQASSDLLGGSLDMMRDTYALLGSHISAGKLTPLAVSWPKRLSALPDVPTFEELGLPNLSLASWYGVVAPAGIPAETLKVLSEKINASLKDPAMQKKLADSYIYTASPSSPPEFKDFIQKQLVEEEAFIKSRHMGR